MLIVCGAAGNLGLEVVSQLKRTGERVIAIDHSSQFPSDLKPDQFFGGIDLTKASDVDAFVSSLREQRTQATGLVNLVGGFSMKPVLEADAEDWMRLMTLNLITMANSCRFLCPLITDGGAVVNVAAAAASKAGPQMGPYSASKAAVIKLSEALGEELKPRRIRVNTVSPTVVDTPTNRSEMPNADFSSWVKPAAIADTIRHLLSDEGSAINGVDLKLG